MKYKNTHTASAQPGRNDICPCGSGKKYKKCCALAAQQANSGQARKDPSIHWQAALRAFELGELVEAQTECDRFLQVRPFEAEALHLRSLIAFRQGRFDEGLQIVGQAIEQAPRVGLYFNTKGLLEQALREEDAAESSFRRAIALDSACAPAQINLGDLLETRGDLDGAEGFYRAATRSNPRSSEAWNNLGKLLNRRERHAEALDALETAIKVRPDFGKAHYNLSCALQAVGRKDEAIAALQQAVKYAPSLSFGWHDLGLNYKERGALPQARAAYERAIELNPDLAQAHANLGNLFLELGLGDRARACFERAHALAPQDGLRIRVALSLPATFQSFAEREAVRQRLRDEIDALMSADLSIHDPHREVALTPFYLAYHGHNDVELLSRIADLFLKASPSLGYIAPHCREQAFSADKEKIEIGFLSSYLGRNHIVNRVMKDYIAAWPRDRFRVIVFHLDRPNADVSEALREGDRAVALPEDLAMARQRIAAEKLDILFYADLGMEPWSYFLSFARLAPVQCTSGGHPVTSGVPNVDFYLASTIDELPAAQAHYRERLVLLEERPVYYFPAEAPAGPKRHADFGLADGRRIYLCPMKPFKIGPEMDETFAKLLAADPAGDIVFVVNYQQELWRQLQRRFARTVPDSASRMKYLSYLSMPDFIALLRLAEVVLDTFAFGGGTTSLESLAVGTPVVTLPGELLRNRGTSGLYRRMGLLDCIAENEEDYVRRAVEIATNPARRASLKAEILAGNSVLFGQQEGIRQASEFLLRAWREKSDRL